jgi:DNA-binding NarL/FixJ family response regulator
MSESHPWDDYVSLQRQADRRKLDAKAWAAEEQAEEFLDGLAANKLHTDPNLRKTWLDNLGTNRAKKHRRRVSILRRLVYFRPGFELSKVHESIAKKETLARVQKKATPDEWAVLFALASGGTYQDLADTRGCSEQTMKTRVSRCRKRLAMTA